MEHSTRRRSLFWPVVLLGVGILWLLSNLGILQPVNAFHFARFWPLILIVTGLDILIGRQSALGSALVGLVTVALIAILVFNLLPPGLHLENFLRGGNSGAPLTVDFARAALTRLAA